MAKARMMLAAIGECHFTQCIITAPIDIDCDQDFTNQLATVDTTLSMDDFHERILGIEKDCGRRTGDKERGIIPIDIDILSFNGHHYHPRDWSRSYVTTLLSEL